MSTTTAVVVSAASSSNTAAAAPPLRDGGLAPATSTSLVTEQKGLLLSSSRGQVVRTMAAPVKENAAGIGDAPRPASCSSWSSPPQRRLPQVLTTAARSDALAMTVQPREKSENSAAALRAAARRLGAGLVQRPALTAAEEAAELSAASTTLLLANGSAASRRGSFVTVDISLNATRRWRHTVMGAGGGGGAAGKRRTSVAGPSGERRGQRTVTVLPNRGTPPPPPSPEDVFRHAEHAKSPGLLPPTPTTTAAADVTWTGQHSRTASLASSLAADDASRPTTEPIPLIEREYTEAEMEEQPALRQLANVWRKLQLANAIVQEADNQTSQQRARSEEERQAQLLNRERAKLILLVGRAYNLERSLEEMLEVQVAQENDKKRQQRRRKGEQALSPDAVESTESDPDRRQACLSRAAEQVQKLKQLHATLFSNHTIPEDELSLRSLNRLVSGIDHLVQEARAQVSPSQVTAARQEQSEARAALSNYKDVMWLIESTDLALVSDLGASPITHEQQQQQEGPPLFVVQNGGGRALGGPPTERQASANSTIHPRTTTATTACSASAHSTTSSTLPPPPPHHGLPIANKGRGTGDGDISWSHPSLDEPSVVPFSLLGDSGWDLRAHEDPSRVLAAVAQVTRATDGMAMLDFMLAAIPDVKEEAALHAGRPTTAPTQAIPGAHRAEHQEQASPTQRGGRLLGNRDDTAERTGGDDGRAGDFAQPAALPAPSASSAARHSSHALTIGSADQEGGRGSWEGGLVSLVESDGGREDSFASGSGVSGQDVPFSFPVAADGASRLPSPNRPDRVRQRSNAKYYPIRSDLLADLKKLYPQFNYDQFIEARRAGRLRSLTPKPDEEYIAEMQNAILRHRAESASRRAARSSLDDDLLMESLLGNIGKRTSQAGGSRATSAASRSAASRSAASPTADGSKATTTVATAPTDGLLPRSAAAPSRGTSAPPAPRHPSSACSAKAEDAPPPMAATTPSEDSSSETVLYDKKLPPCGLRCTVVGKCDPASKAAASRADASAPAKGSRKGGGPGGAAFDRYFVSVKNEHTYSAAVATLVFVQSKLPGLTLAVEPGVEAVGPTELRMMLQPGQLQRFAVLLPAANARQQQRRMGGIIFKDSLRFTGELSNGFDAFPALRPGSGGASDDPDNIDAFSMDSDDATHFVSIPPVPPLPTTTATTTTAADTKKDGKGKLTPTVAGRAAEGKPGATKRPATKLPPVTPPVERAASPSVEAGRPEQARQSASPPLTYVFPPPTPPGDGEMDPEKEAVENNLVALTVIQVAANAATAGAEEEKKDAEDPMAALLSGLDVDTLPDAANQLLEHVAQAEGLDLRDQDSQQQKGPVAARPPPPPENDMDGEDDPSLPRDIAGDSSNFDPANASFATAAPAREGRHPSASSSAPHVSRKRVSSSNAAPITNPVDPSAFAASLSGRRRSSRSSVLGGAYHGTDGVLLPATGLCSPPTLVIASATSRPLSASEVASFSSPGGIQYDTEALRAAAEVEADQPAPEDPGRDGRVPSAEEGRPPRPATSLAKKKKGRKKGKGGGAASLHQQALAEARQGEVREVEEEVPPAALTSPSQRPHPLMAGEEVDEAPFAAILADPPPGCYTSITPGTARMNVLMPADAVADEVVHALLTVGQGGRSSSDGPNPQHPLPTGQEATLRAEEATVPVREQQTPAQKTAMLVSDVMRSIVGKEARSALQRGKVSGPLAGAGGAATAKTELAILEQEARALYLEDPLRYDAVMDDLVKLATTQLTGTDSSTESLAALVQTKELAAIMKAVDARSATPAASVGEGEAHNSSGVGVCVASHSALSSVIHRPSCSPQIPTSLLAPSNGDTGDGLWLATGSSSADANNNAQAEGDRRKQGSSEVAGANSRGGATKVLFTVGEEEAEEMEPRAHPSPPHGNRRVEEQLTLISGNGDFANTNDGAAEVQRILLDQLNAKVFMKLIVEQMKILWARKAVEGREKARDALDRTLARMLDLSWHVERRRVVHVAKLIHILDRRTGRVHGWLPFYKDDNVLVDAAAFGAGNHRSGRLAGQTVQEDRWGQRSSSYRNTSGLRTVPTATSSLLTQQQQRDGGGDDGLLGCPRYLHYQEPALAQARGDIFLSSLQLRRLLHAMCLAKRRRLMPLLLVRPPTEPDRSNGTRHALFGYRRHVVLLSALRHDDSSGKAARNGVRGDEPFADGVEMRRRLRKTLMPLTKSMPTATVSYLHLTPRERADGGGAAKQQSGYERQKHALPSITQLLRSRRKPHGQPDPA